MRILSRIGSWLRGAPPLENRPQEILERGLDPSLVGRMPRVPVERFRARLLEAISEAHGHPVGPLKKPGAIASGQHPDMRERVVLATLDPSVFVLVIPKVDGASAERDRRISIEIDQALSHLEGRGQGLSSVTWGALREARPPFSPSPSEWAGEHAERFRGDAGIVFFIDVEAVALAMAHAAEAQGLVARVDDDAELVRVRDARFEAHVGTGPLLAEALWTGRGPYSVVARRAAQLPNEMRSFQSLVKGLERRFPGGRFEVRGESVAAYVDGTLCKIDYRHLCASQLASGLGVDGYLARVNLDDIAEQDAEPAVLVRSASYLKAYPDALAMVENNAALVAVKLDDGVATVVKKQPGDHAARFEHYRDEANRQLPFFTFSGHAFVVEQSAKGGPSRAVCLVGDKAASVGFHATLVKGAVEHLAPLEDKVRVVCPSENSACFLSHDARPELVDEAKRRALQLEGDLFADGSDPLNIDREVVLDDTAHGHFDLALVPQAYFNVRDQATTRSDLGRGHSDYLRGLSFELLGRPDLALACFERAVRASSADGEMNLALGRTLSSLGEHSRAVLFLEKAAAALPEHAEAVNALGVALYRNGDHMHARAAFQRAVKLAPDEVGFLVNLGRACCDQKLYGEAKAALEHALRVEPTSAEAHASMAVLFHKTGERQRAMHHAREALAEQPDDETVRELLKMLEEEP